MRRIVAILSLLPMAAAAFDVQIGVSLRSIWTGGWFSDTVEIGGTSKIDTISATGVTKLRIPVSIADLNFMRGPTFSITVADNFALRQRFFVPSDSVVIDGDLGYDNRWGTNYEGPLYTNAVVTMRGNPYSTVVNDTGADRTINGVLIPDGKSARLLFPLYLVMEELPNAKFYDLDTGEEITPTHTGDVMETAVYYRNGAYCLNWGGDFRISCDRPTRNATTNDVPIYADLKSEHAGAILFGRSGSPLYGPYSSVTNFTLMTWWDFDQGQWGSSPQAYINDVCVCSSHSTGHIIDYEIDPSVFQVSFSNPGSFTFTMSQTPQSGKSGGSCVMRCWGRYYGADASGYEKAPVAHKAEVSAGTDVATFRVTINADYTWKVEPVN